MNVKTKDLKQSQTELTITVSPEEYQKYIDRAAKEISEKLTIKGFRPGHAPYEQVKTKVGEMKIYEHALEYIVRRFYEEAVKQESLSAVGMPQIEVEKLAPGNDIVFKATVGLLPVVTLADVSKIKIKREEKEINDEEINRVLGDIAKMRATEALKDGAATEEDKIVVDMDMLDGAVPLEGGQAKDHGVYLNDDYYIPGLQKELLGLKKGNEKEFKLTMPKDHYQKQFAGKDLTFKIKVKDVFERKLPEMNEEFAKGMGQDSIEALKNVLKENIEKEAAQKADQRYEIALLDHMIDKSKITDVPQILIDAEKDKMYFELKRGVEQQGMEWEKYMDSTEKTEQELVEGFTDQAKRRAMAALVSRAIAKENNLNPTGEDIDAEIEKIRETYKDEPQAQENLGRPEVRGSIETLIRNRQVIAWLKDQTTSNV